MITYKIKLENSFGLDNFSEGPTATLPTDDSIINNNHHRSGGDGYFLRVKVQIL